MERKYAHLSAEERATIMIESDRGAKPSIDRSAAGSVALDDQPGAESRPPLSCQSLSGNRGRSPLPATTSRQRSVSQAGRRQLAVATGP